MPVLYMQMKNLTKIDKYYVVLVILLLVMAFVTIAVLKGIFSSIEIAGEVDDSLLNATTPRIDKDKLQETLDKINNPKFVPLDL